MNLALPAFGNRSTHIFPALLLCLGLSGGIFCFPLSYLSHSNVIIGLLLFPFTLFITGKQRNNHAYLLCVLLFGILSLTYGLRIAYFFTLAFFVLWIVEFSVGRCHPLIVFLLAFMSPVFSQVTTILGFPLRLQLSMISAGVLQMVGLDARAQGNMIVLDGLTFSVDEACMGLNMLAMSMLMGVFIVGYRHRVSGTRPELLHLLLFFFVVFALNLITNLLRIIMLVLFRIPPENFLHEAIGVLCFAFYVIIPLFLLSSRMTRNGHDQVQAPGASPVTSLQKVRMVAIALGVLFTGMSVGVQKSDIGTRHADIHCSNGQIEKLDDGITKVTTEQLLVYVKPIPEFFTGEHTPLMCWKGSGYAFSGVQEIVVEGETIYAGKLVKETDALFTAWWYSNGKVHTISQLDWRMRMLKGEDKFCLVNITAKDQETLMRHVASVFRDHSLSVRYR